MVRLTLKGIAVFLWMGIALMACWPGDSGEPVRRTRFIMGTLVEITVSHPDPDLIQTATTEAFDEMQTLGSEISTLAQSAEAS